MKSARCSVQVLAIVLVAAASVGNVRAADDDVVEIKIKNDSSCDVEKNLVLVGTYFEPGQPSKIDYPIIYGKEIAKKATANKVAHIPKNTQWHLEVFAYCKGSQMKKRLYGEASCKKCQNTIVISLSENSRKALLRVDSTESAN